MRNIIKIYKTVEFREQKPFEHLNENEIWRQTLCLFSFTPLDAAYHMELIRNRKLNYYEDADDIK